MIVILGKKLFEVDQGAFGVYEDWTEFVLTPVDGGDPIKTTAANIRLLTEPVLECQKDTYLKAYVEATEKAINSIKIRDVMRLIVNNDRYIHYLIGQVNMVDIACREGGMYLAFAIPEGNDTPVLYVGNTGAELEANILANIPARAIPHIATLQDNYLEEGLTTLLSRFETISDSEDLECIQNVFVSEWKDPQSIDPDVEECAKHHQRHCKFCLSIGYVGTHKGNEWNNDGVVHDDRTKHTHTTYFRGFKNTKHGDMC